MFSKGGFVSVPVVFAAHSLGIPVISHESDITMGLANKLILPKSVVMCCSFHKTTSISPKKCLYTGTPIRQELFEGNKQTAQTICGFHNLNKPCVLFMGGSLGATAINNAVINCITKLTPLYNIIHITGKGNQTPIQQSGYYQCEFTQSIQHFFALSNVVVTRAGSNTINELLALNKPMLLIPLPKTESRGDQIENAQEFEKNKYAVTLYQQNINPQTLLNNINTLYRNSTTYVNAMKTANNVNAITTILNLIKKHSK